VGADRVDYSGRDIGWDRPFVDSGHVGQDDDPAVERGHRRLHVLRLDQHRHAP
jgi:hypothetical protein